VRSATPTEIMEFRVSEEPPGFISVVAMVATAWVLDRAYGPAASEIAPTLKRILQADTLVVESAQEVFQARRRLRRKTARLPTRSSEHSGPKPGCTRTRRSTTRP
jgi:predicted nucleic-acid-binding protein